MKKLLSKIALTFCAPRRSTQSNHSPQLRRVQRRLQRRRARNIIHHHQHIIQTAIQRYDTGFFEDRRHSQNNHRADFIRALTCPPNDFPTGIVRRRFRHICRRCYRDAATTLPRQLLRQRAVTPRLTHHTCLRLHRNARPRRTDRIIPNHLPQSVHNPNSRSSLVFVCRFIQCLMRRGSFFDRTRFRSLAARRIDPRLTDHQPAAHQDSKDRTCHNTPVKFCRESHGLSQTSHLRSSLTRVK